MKVRITTTVDIDPAAWELNYGVQGPAAIRADVQRYCADTITEQLSLVGVLT